MLSHQQWCRLGFDEIKSASELCTAAAQGKVDLLRHYIKGGINVNAADYDKRTALHIAAADGGLEAVSDLCLSFLSVILCVLYSSHLSTLASVHPAQATNNPSVKFAALFRKHLRTASRHWCC